MREIIKISEITDSVFVEVKNSIKHNGEFAYHLGRPEEIKMCLEKLLKVLNLNNIVKMEVVK